MQRSLVFYVTTKDFWIVTTIHLVRHGHVHNPQKVLYGRLPGFNLSEKGIAQATVTADFLEKRPISAVFSSPMLRARRTAQLIMARHRGLRLSASQLLQEVYTKFDGSPLEAMEKIDWEFYTDVEAPYETPLDILTRTQRFFKKVRRLYRGQEVVAVSHGDIVCFALAWMGNFEITGETKRRIALGDVGYPATASVTSIHFKSDAADEIPTFSYHIPYGEELYA